MMPIDIVILAAGQGSRMKSSIPKVLHTLGGKPMLQHVIDSASVLDDSHIHVVVGHGGESVKSSLANKAVSIVLQPEQKGTGHAVAQAMPFLSQGSTVLVLYGDVPLIKSSTLEQLVKLANSVSGSLALLTVNLTDPTGYGRIQRSDSNNILGIVEHKDASKAELAIKEVNTGILAVNQNLLARWLPELSSNNAQGEYYLTDIVAMAVAANVPVVSMQPDLEQEVQGVNSPLQLSELERWYQRQLAEQQLTAGVRLADPNRIDIRGILVCGSDVFLDINLVVEGNVSLADGVNVGPNCCLKNCNIGAGTYIKANSIIEDSKVGSNCDIGPFARLRPGTELADNSRIGNFVETKKSFIGKGSKVNHLSYIGDAVLGSDVNVGAGTITCNYDGANKSTTNLADGVFVGSNSSLVAPVNVGKNATLGAGSTITKNVPENTLAVTRAKQIAISNWARPTKKETKE